MLVCMHTVLLPVILIIFLLLPLLHCLFLDGIKPATVQGDGAAAACLDSVSRRGTYAQ